MPEDKYLVTSGNEKFHKLEDSVFFLQELLQFHGQKIISFISVRYDASKIFFSFYVWFTPRAIYGLFKTL